MTTRTDARRDVMEQAHEGHEEYRPKTRVRRVGPRKVMAGEYGYDYLEAILNGQWTWKQIAGLLVTLIGLSIILLWLVLMVLQTR